METILEWVRERILQIGLSVSLAGCAIGWFLYDWQAFLKSPLQLPQEGIIYFVAPGVSLSKVADDLAQQKILTSKIYFFSYAFLTGNFNSIKYGEYHFDADITAVQLFQKLSRGLIYQRRLVLIEGWSFKQILQAIQKAPFLMRTFDNEHDLFRALPLPYLNPEGIFFPNTYFYHRGMTDVLVLKKAYNLMQKHLEKSWNARDLNLPLRSPYEALILASIVEKEAKLDKERPMIAGVLITRLKQNMKLQADPTVIYGLGDHFNGDLSHEHLQIDTSYNTYLHAGLPPTPIALPSEKSIDAALHPANTDALYFVAKGDGSHLFSNTLAEHLVAVKRYQSAKGQ